MMEGKEKKPRKPKGDVFKLDTEGMPFSEVVKRVLKGGADKPKPKDKRS